MSSSTISVCPSNLEACPFPVRFAMQGDEHAALATACSNQIRALRDSEGTFQSCPPKCTEVDTLVSLVVRELESLASCCKHNTVQAQR